MSEPTYGMTNVVRGLNYRCREGLDHRHRNQPCGQGLADHRRWAGIGGRECGPEDRGQGVPGHAGRSLDGHWPGVGVRGAAGAHPRQLRTERGPGRRGRGRGTEAAIDLDIVIEYGVSIADLGRRIQRNVKQSVELMTGLRVVKVNVAVDDVHLPAPGEQVTTPSRVS